MQFAALTVLTFVVVASLTVLVSQRIAQDEAVRDARARTIGIGNGIAAPLVNSKVRQKDPQAMKALDTALRDRMLDGTVAHLAVWDLDGRLIWADDVDAVDHHDGLPLELTLAETPEPGAPKSVPRSIASVASGSEALVEVYVRVPDAEGQPFILEAYTPRALIQTDIGTLMSELLPLTLGSLLVLSLAIVPLALSLARRIDRANGSRREVLHRSLLSWKHERERLAQTLHDDVIQDLSALGYALPAVLVELPSNPRGKAALVAGERMNEVLLRSVRSLRLVLTDLTPSGLGDAGLEEALRSLAQQHRERNMNVELTLDSDLHLGDAAGTLVYRIVREGLQNVAKHAAASHVTVAVSRRATVVDVVVDDNGRGLTVAAGAKDGHVGLRLLERSVTDVDGSFDLSDRPGGGVRLRAAIPVEAPSDDDELYG